MNKKFYIAVILILLMIVQAACVGNDANINNDITETTEEPSDDVAEEHDFSIYSWDEMPEIVHGNAITMFNLADIDKLESRSTDIVRARIWGRTAVEIVAKSEYQIITQLEVLEVFQGNASPGGKIEITQTLNDQFHGVWSVFRHFQHGDELVFFLDSAQREDNLMELTLPLGSVYMLVSLGGFFIDVSWRNRDIFTKEDVPPYYSAVIFTTEDLQQIRERNFP